jgi:hypothetical protein
MAEERKDVVVQTQCGSLKTHSGKPKAPSARLADELTRHVLGAVAAIVKWAKTVEEKQDKK